MTSPHALLTGGEMHIAAPVWPAPVFAASEQLRDVTAALAKLYQRHPDLMLHVRQVMMWLNCSLQQALDAFHALQRDGVLTESSDHLVIITAGHEPQWQAWQAKVLAAFEDRREPVNYFDLLRELSGPHPKVGEDEALTCAMSLLLRDAVLVQTSPNYFELKA
jgi:hypothetical protein